MPFFVNEKKTGTENLYDLVAATNPKAVYIPNRVTLGPPVFNEQSGYTTVTITPIEGSGYIPPEVTVSYNRQPPVHASGTQNLPPLELENRQYTQSELKAVIAEYLKLIPDDVIITGFGEDDEILVPEFVGDTREGYGYRVNSKPDSYMYEDGDLAPFEGEFISGEKNVPLWFALSETSLGGFIESPPKSDFNELFETDILPIF